MATTNVNVHFATSEEDISVKAYHIEMGRVSKEDYHVVCIGDVTMFFNPVQLEETINTLIAYREGGCEEIEKTVKYHKLPEQDPNIPDFLDIEVAAKNSCCKFEKPDEDKDMFSENGWG